MSQIDHTLNKAVSGNYSFLIKRLDALDPSQRYQVSVRPYHKEVWIKTRAYGSYTPNLGST
jgi:hypothetical protein